MTEHRPSRTGDAAGQGALERDAGVGLSLIVSSHNRAAHLAPFLDSLRRIRTSRRWEAVIVDNGSSDDTWAILNAFATTAGLPIKLLRAPTDSSAHSPRRAASYARNAAIRSARGEILCFTDDDCYPNPDLIDAVVDAFERNDIGFLGGRVLLFDPDDAHICITSRTEDTCFPGGSFVTTDDIQGACMAFRRQVFDQIGLFDTVFGAGAPLKGAEDCDLVARASLAGWNGGFFTSVVVRHHHRRRGGDAVKIARNYDYARGAFFLKLLLKHPEARSRVLKQWYWDTFCHFHSWRHLVKSWREIRGACHYAFIQDSG